jgi:hypothetical protein
MGGLFFHVLPYSFPVCISYPPKPRFVNSIVADRDLLQALLDRSGAVGLPEHLGRTWFSPLLYRIGYVHI